MLFDFDENGIVSANVREICEFLFRSGDAYTGSASLPLEKMKKGTKFHRDFQKKRASQHPGYTPEYHLAREENIGHGFTLVLSGIADGICEDPSGEPFIDEIKTTSKKPSELDFGSVLKYDFQLYLYAYIYLKCEKSDRLTLNLVYHNCDSEETSEYSVIADACFLEEKFRTVCELLLPWLIFIKEHNEKRNESIKALPFPFGSYRKGQRELCASVYRSVRDCTVLFAQAPTGTGKTVSTLFPAVKALGEGKGRKIFYLTAKTAARGVAMGAADIMEKSGLYARRLELCAKSVSCIGGGNCMPHLCPYSKGHFDRVNSAVWDVITHEMTVTPAVIASYAEKHTVCPHELALDVSYFCDIIVGDYNHLYDPQAQLQRYFSVGGDYTVLCDEAHNLPDRAREMYSASLSENDLRRACRALKEAPKKVRRTFGSLSRALKNIGNDIVAESLERRIFDGGVEPEVLEKAEKLADAYKGFLSEDTCRDEKEKTLEVFFAVNFFVQMAYLSEQHPASYKSYAEADGRNVVVFLACTDPSPLIRAVSDSVRSVTFFSATLCPFDYYTELLGHMTENDRFIRLPSPFPAENQLVAVYGGISTRLRDREGSYGHAAEIIYSSIKSKTGNYLAFFPSFRYLCDVLDAFEDAHPEIRTVVQKQGMDREARDDFLSSFDSHGDETLLGFAVCGGVFSEGIDLVGEKLSGVIVLGTGMPSISFERDLVRSAYETPEDRTRGFRYAYTYPGLNRVFQASGRVIRTENDKGFIVLADERFTSPEYTKQFPGTWFENMHRVRNVEGLEKVIRRFWED